MATSLRDLLAELERALRTSVVEQPAADDAVSALGHLGRAVTRLADDGLGQLGPDATPTHAIAVTELGTACQAAARSWSGLPTGRLSDLAGAAADILDRLRGESGGSERWAAAIELSTTARRCVRLAEDHPPYAGVPPLARVRRLAGAVNRKSVV